MIAQAHAAGACTLHNGCAALSVSPSGYRQWSKRTAQGPSLRQRQDAALTEHIVAIHAASGETYGSPRIHASLKQAHKQADAQLFVCSKHRVARLMRQAGVRSQRAAKRRKVQTTDADHALPVAENHLARTFTATAPNQKWVADVTYIPTAAGWCFLAVILDLYSRKVVGWALASRFTQALVGRALTNALAVRRPPRLLHSDRGVQYCSESYQQALARAGIQCSMSRRANCYDNAVMESFFASLKTETRLAKGAFANPDQARRALFAYIEGFYNTRRLHSTLGYQSPDAFERATATAPHSAVA